MHNYKQLDLIENALSVPVLGTKEKTNRSSFFMPVTIRPKGRVGSLFFCFA